MLEFRKGVQVFFTSRLNLHSPKANNKVIRMNWNENKKITYLDTNEELNDIC